MNRRSFFKVLGAAGAVAAMPTMLLDIADVTPPDVQQVGLIREVMAYDIYHDCYMLRHDIWSNDIQLGLNYVVRSTEDFAPYRIRSKERLEEAMKTHGIWWNDLMPLPLPPYIEHAEYV